jgi:hypothetical protein
MPRRKRKTLQILGFDPSTRRVALDNGWTYDEATLVAWLSGSSDTEQRELGVARPYFAEVFAREGVLVVEADPADPRATGLDQQPPLPSHFKPSSKDPSSDRSRL